MKTLLTTDNHDALGNIRERIDEALAATKDGFHLAEMVQALVATVHACANRAVKARGFKVQGAKGQKAGAAA